MNRERFVLHLNVADFAVAVERVVDRSLREKPLIVAALKTARATVYDMSNEAYNDGVRKGMPLRPGSPSLPVGPAVAAPSGTLQKGHECFCR